MYYGLIPILSDGLVVGFAKNIESHRPRAKKKHTKKYLAEMAKRRSKADE